MPAPLDGVRILAISQFGAGPYGTLLLSDLGAEVIKIEDPEFGGDVGRYVPPFEGDRDSLYFQSFNRGKKSIAINLRNPEGRTAFHDLVRTSDAVYNNLRGDIPARLGLTYGDLQGLNPAIVCCSLSAFGREGPRASQPGYDAIVQAMAGYMSVTGEPGGPPTKCGVSVIDFAGGIASALGLVSALYNARKTGVGCDVDASLFGTAISMLTYFATWSLNRDWAPARVAGSAHQTLTPSGNFKTSDGWVTIFCAKEKFWQALVEVMELPQLAQDRRFDTFASRNEHRDALIPILERRFLERTTAEWLDALSPGVPCAPVNDVATALRDPQVEALGMVAEAPHPVFGELKHAACPIQMPGVGSDKTPGPTLGQHTRQLLSDLPGYDSARVAGLFKSGAVS